MQHDAHNTKTIATPKNSATLDIKLEMRLMVSIDSERVKKPNEDKTHRHQRNFV